MAGEQDIFSDNEGPFIPAEVIRSSGGLQVEYSYQRIVAPPTEKASTLLMKEGMHTVRLQLESESAYSGAGIAVRFRWNYSPNPDSYQSRVTDIRMQLVIRDRAISEGGNCIVNIDEESFQEDYGNAFPGDPLNWTYNLRILREAILKSEQEDYPLDRGGPFGLYTEIQEAASSKAALAEFLFLGTHKLSLEYVKWLRDHRNSDKRIGELETDFALLLPHQFTRAIIGHSLEGVFGTMIGPARDALHQALEDEDEDDVPIRKTTRQHRHPPTVIAYDELDESVTRYQPPAEPTLEERTQVDEVKIKSLDPVKLFAALLSEKTVNVGESVLRYGTIAREIAKYPDSHLYQWAKHHFGEKIAEARLRFISVDLILRISLHELYRGLGAIPEYNHLLDGPIGNDELDYAINPTSWYVNQSLKGIARLYDRLITLSGFKGRVFADRPMDDYRGLSKRDVEFLRNYIQSGEYARRGETTRGGRFLEDLGLTRLLESGETLDEVIDLVDEVDQVDDDQ
ncbi:MAG: hypothetical protein ACE5EE_11100 [Fidelibacterota bacterium]